MVKGNKYLGILVGSSKEIFQIIFSMWSIIVIIQYFLLCTGRCKDCSCNRHKSFVVSLLCVKFFFYVKFWYFLQTATNLQAVKCVKFHNFSSLGVAFFFVLLYFFSHGGTFQVFLAKISVWLRSLIHFWKKYNHFLLQKYADNIGTLERLDLTL